MTDLSVGDTRSVAVSIQVPSPSGLAAVTDYYGSTASAILSVDAASGVRANDAAGVSDVETFDASTVWGAGVSVAPDGSFTLTPGSRYVGVGSSESIVDSFTYSLRSSGGQVSTATVYVTITGENESPTAVDDSPTEETTSLYTRAGVAVVLDSTDLTRNDIDPDVNDQLTVVAINGTSASGASITIVDGDFVYDPTGVAAFDALPAGASVLDEITYTVQDPDGATDVGVAQIWVQSSLNIAPTASPSTITVTEDGEIEAAFVSLLEGAADTDSLPSDSPLALVEETVVSVRGATVTLAADGTFVYDASAATAVQALAPGETIDDSFEFRVTDGFDASDVATVTLSVTGINDAPTAGDDEYFGLSADGLLTTTLANGLLSNDFDVDSTPPLIIDPSRTDVLSAGGAQVTLRPDGTFDYDPAGAFAELADGEVAFDTFTYVVLDDRGAESVATVRIEIIGVDDAPVAGKDGIERGFWTVATQAIEVPASDGVLANDFDFDSASNGTILEASFDGFSQYGARVVVNADGSFSYDPTVSPTIAQLQVDGIDVVDTFTYEVREVTAPGESFSTSDNASDDNPPEASSEGVVEIILRSGPSGYSFDLVAQGVGDIGYGVSINNKGNVAFGASTNREDLYIWSEEAGAKTLVPGDFGVPPSDGFPLARFSDVVQINDDNRVFATRQWNVNTMLGMPMMGLPLVTFAPAVLTYAELWNGGAVLEGASYGSPRQIGVGDMGLANAGLRWGNPQLIDFQFITLLGALPGIISFAITAPFQLVPRIWTINPVWSSAYFTPVNPVWNAFQDPDNFDFDTLNAVSLATSLMPIWVPQIYTTPFQAIFPTSASTNNQGQSIFVATTVNTDETDLGLKLVTYGHAGRQPYKSTDIDAPVQFAMLADTGHSVYVEEGGNVVIRDFDLNQTGGSGFQSAGTRAAISDSGHVAVVGSGPDGDGVYVIEAESGAYVKVAGLSGDGTVDPNEIEVDGQDVGPFEAFINGPVGINGPATTDEPGTPYFTVSFMAIVDGREGLHSVSFFPGEFNDAPIEPFQYIGHNRVLNLGEMLPGIGAIDTVQSFDLINNAGQLAFTDGEKVVRANPPVFATGDLIYAFERRDLSENEVFKRDGGAALARFTAGDPDADAGQFEATIDFGDGTTGTGTIVPHADLPLTFEVVADHQYPREGPYAITIQITDTVNETGGIAVSLANIVNTVNEEDIEKLVLVDDEGNETEPTIVSFAAPFEPENSGGGGGGGGCGDEPHQEDQDLQSAGLATRVALDRSTGQYEVVSTGFGGFTYSYGLATAGSDGQGTPNASVSGGGSAINIRRVIARGTIDTSFSPSGFTVQEYETGFDGSMEGSSCSVTSSFAEESTTDVSSSSFFVDEKTFNGATFDWTLSTEKEVQYFTRGERFVDSDLQSQIDSLIGGGGTSFVGNFTVRGEESTVEVLREFGGFSNITRDYMIDTVSTVDHRGGRQSFEFVHVTETESSFRSTGAVSEDAYGIRMTRDVMTTIVQQSTTNGPRSISTSGTSQSSSTTEKAGSLTGTFTIETTTNASSNTTTVETNQSLRKESQATSSGQSTLEGTGEAIGGGFSFVTTDNSSINVDSTLTNQTLSSVSSQNSVSDVTVNQSGNLYGGDYVYRENRNVQYSSTDETTNQTQRFDTVSSGTQDFIVLTTGNKKTGAFDIRETNTSSATTNVTETNQSRTNTSSTTTETEGFSNKEGNSTSGEFEFDGYSFALIVASKAMTNGPLRTNTEETTEVDSTYEGDGSSRTGQSNKTERNITSTISEQTLQNQGRVSTTTNESENRDTVVTLSNHLTGDYTRDNDGSAQAVVTTVTTVGDRTVNSTTTTETSDSSYTVGNTISTVMTTDGGSVIRENRSVSDSILSESTITEAEKLSDTSYDSTSNSIVGTFTNNRSGSGPVSSTIVTRNQTSYQRTRSVGNLVESFESDGNTVLGNLNTSTTSSKNATENASSSNSARQVFTVVAGVPVDVFVEDPDEASSSTAIVSHDTETTGSSNTITGEFSSTSNVSTVRDASQARTHLSRVSNGNAYTTTTSDSASSGNEIVGDVVRTTDETVITSGGSETTNQSLTETETIVVSRSDRSTTETGNRYTGVFNLATTSSSENIVDLEITNETKTETRRTTNLSDGVGTHLVNRVTGERSLLETTITERTVDSLATNQGQTIDTLTTSDSTSSVDRLSNENTGLFSENRTGEATIVVGSIVTIGSKTKRTDDTTTSTSISSNSGNEVLGNYSGSEESSQTTNGTSLVTNQTYREDGTHVSTLTTLSTRTGNTVTGIFDDTFTTESSLDSSQTITNQTLRNIVTVDTAAMSDGRSFGNNLDGSVTREENAQSRTDRVESVENGPLIANTTSINEGTSQSVATGNAIEGDMVIESMSSEIVTQTEIAINADQRTEVTTRDQTSTETTRNENQILGTFDYTTETTVETTRTTVMTNQELRSQNDTSSQSEITVEQDGNLITGVFRRDERTQSNTTASESEVNRGRTETFNATEVQSSVVITTGNSIAGTSSGTNEVVGETTNVHAIENQSLQVNATITEATTRTQTFASNSVSGIASSTTTTTGTRSRTETVVNGTLNASVTETSSFSNTAGRDSNLIVGTYTDSNSGSQSSRLEGADSNKTLAVSYVTLVNQSFTSGGSGNTVTGDYARNAETDSTTVRTATETNGPLTVESVTTTTDNVVENGTGNSVAGTSTTAVTSDTNETVDQTDTNQTLTVTIDSTSDTLDVVTSSNNQFTGAFSSSGTTTLDSTSTEVSSNQGLASTVTIVTASNSTYNASGNAITGAESASESSESESTLTSTQTVQTETLSETTDLETESTSSSTGNSITGVYDASSSTTTVSSVASALTNQTLSASGNITTTTVTDSVDSGNTITGDYQTDSTTTIDEDGTQRDENQVWIIDSTNSLDSEVVNSETGNNIDGTYASTVSTMSTVSANESNLINPNTTNSSTETTDSTTTTTGDHITGAFSATSSSDSASTFTETFAYLGLTASKTSSTTSTSSSTATGNEIAATRTSTLTTDSSTAGTSTEANQGLSVESSFTSAITSESETTSNAITGVFSTVTTQSSNLSSAETSLNQTLALSTTNTRTEDSETTRTGNSVTGDFSESVDTSFVGASTETVTNQTLTSEMTTNITGTSESDSTGNEITGVTNGSNSSSDATTRSQSDTNQSQTVSVTESLSSTVVGTSADNAITGDFSSDTQVNTTLESAETRTNQTVTETQNREETSVTTSETSGNSIVGDYSSETIVTMSADVTGSEVNQTLTVSTTQTETSSMTTVETGNLRFDTYEADTDATTTIVTSQTSANQTLSITSSLSSTTTSDVNRTGNRTSGAFEEVTTQAVTTAETSTSTNQTETSTSETSDSIDRTTTQTGNDITGLYTVTVTSSQSSTQELGEANTDRDISGTTSTTSTESLTGSGNLITGASTVSVVLASNQSTSQSGTIDDRSFTVTETAVMNSEVETTSNDITTATTSTTTSSDSYEYAKSTTYADGTDEKSVEQTSEVSLTTTSNAITGVYSSSSSSTDVTTLSETGSRSETYTASSTVNEVTTATDSGNSVVGTFDTSGNSQLTSSISRSLTDAAGTTMTVSESVADDVTSEQAGNRVTGAYTNSATLDSLVTTTQTIDSVAAGHNQTAVNVVDLNSTTSGSGNSVTGTHTGTTNATRIVTLTQDGTVANNLVDFDSTSTDVSTTATSGNDVTGVSQHTRTGTDTYSFTQTVLQGPGQVYTLTGDGTRTYTETIDVQATTGDTSSTRTGTDTYNLNQSGSNGSGVFSVDLSGEDTYTETETSNSETGTFSRETDVDGTVTGTRTVAGATNAFTEAVDQVVTQSGNYVDGDIDITVTGDGRYDALVEHVDTSNAATGTTGNLDYSPIGTPMFMGSAPTLPTAGGTEALTAIQAASIASYAVASTGTLAAASFRGPQSTLINSIVPGSSLSGSAMQQQYAMQGANSVDQYCFPAGTEVLMADGSAKRIEQVETGDVVASANVSTEALLAVHVGGAATTETGSLTAGSVTETYHNGPQPLLHVHLGESSIATTEGHPFYVVAEDAVEDGPNGSWVLAGELSPGDRLVAADGALLTVSAITRDEGPAVPVYNFCVEQHHNYHVRLPGTDHFVLVHNDSFGLYTYGHALVPVVIEALNDWVAEVTSQIEQMLETLFSPVTDALNYVVEGAGIVIGAFDADLGQSIVTTAQEGRENNTLFGVSASAVGIAVVSAAATVATFGVTAGVGILLVGAAAGIANVYIRSELGGPAFTFNAAFEGMINGITNPFGATFGVYGGAIAVAMNGPGTNEEILSAYDYGNRAGTALGTIVGGLAMTGRAAYLRSGSMGYAMKAMAPGAAGAVGGFAYGQMTGRDFATSMEIAAVASMVMDLGSTLFIKCFVAGTPVWVPVQGDAETWAAASQPTVFAGADASTARIAAGFSLAVLTSVAFAALMKPRDEEDPLDEETRQRQGVDSVFGSSSDSWQELADILWSDPHADERKFGLA